MNYSKQKIALLLATFLMLIQCDTELSVDIPEHRSLLTVEGWIDQDYGARVLLTLSAPFFSEIDSINLRDYSVTTAKVTIRSNEGQEILTLKPTDIYFPPYYYFGSEIRGELHGKYELEIDFRGKKYSASTTIPSLTKTDSVWFKKNDSDTLGLLWIRFYDNKEERNFYRTLTKRKGIDEKFIPTLTSVFTDEQFNGETIEFSLSKGNANILDIESQRFFAVGDTIILRFCSFDEEHYNFWNSLGIQKLNSGNPFAASNSAVESNIEDGLGIWGGYSVWYDTVIAK